MKQSEGKGERNRSVTAYLEGVEEEEGNHPKQRPRSQEPQDVDHASHSYQGASDDHGANDHKIKYTLGIICK